jgi:hypothetical protein
MMAWKDQKRKLHFGVSDTGVGGVKSRDSSSQESRSCEMRNAEILKQAHQQRLHFGVSQTGKSKVSDTGSWRSQESRLFITGVPKLRNVKRRNTEKHID